jgi:hypothetical protein
MVADGLGASANILGNSPPVSIVTRFVHWAYDKTAGIAQGRCVADYVFEQAFVPRH